MNLTIDCEKSGYGQLCLKIIPSLGWCSIQMWH